ncbi:MAG: hypothetical protein BA861_09060 [Desulfobacterales bacterium S3730MH5]|nr:MAG: hypothetical protein BA861_09060 [Desulfobacterales bacterium S3730MH5]
MTDTAVKVLNLSKLYKIDACQQGYKTLRESIMGALLIAPFCRLAQRAKRKNRTCAVTRQIMQHEKKKRIITKARKIENTKKCR